MAEVELYPCWTNHMYPDWYEHLREDMAFYWHDFNVYIEKYCYTDDGLLKHIETFDMDAPSFFRLYIQCETRHHTHFASKGQVFYCRWEGFTYIARIGRAYPASNGRVQMHKITKEIFRLDKKRLHYYYYVHVPVWRNDDKNRRILL